MNAYAFVMYGLGGAAVDPAGGEALMVQRIAALGVNVAASPYQWTDTQAIADAIQSVPKDAKIIIGGDSLGACSTPLIASAFAPSKRIIDYIFAFQPSVYGNNVAITSNVARARCIYNPNFIETMGLGAEKWFLADGNTATHLDITASYDLHPGDNVPANQDLILGDIQQVIAPLKTVLGAVITPTPAQITAGFNSAKVTIMAMVQQLVPAWAMGYVNITDDEIHSISDAVAQAVVNAGGTS